MRKKLLAAIFLALLCFAYCAKRTSGPKNLRRKPEGWCGTHRGSKRDLENVGVCTKGKCDLVEERDLWLLNENSDYITLNVHFIVFKESSSAQPQVSRQAIDDQIVQLNKDYAQAKFNFTGSVDFVVSSRWSGRINDYDFDAMQEENAVDPQNQINVIVFKPADTYLLGEATFPWDANAKMGSGSIVLNADAVGEGETTLSHELGHQLGLRHVHAGPSESPKCLGCYEYAGEPSDFAGDLCSDTNPTPVNFKCSNPSGRDCRGNSWGDTPFENIMSYAPDACVTEFTPQQIARMRCWATETYPSGAVFDTVSNASECTGSDKCSIYTLVDGKCVVDPKCNGTVDTPCLTQTCDPATGDCIIAAETCDDGISCTVDSCSNTTGCISLANSCQRNQNQNCCSIADTPFCSDSVITTCTCTLDPHCCEVEWDKFCVETADIFCGLSCPPTGKISPESGCLSPRPIVADGLPIDFDSRTLTTEHTSACWLRAKKGTWFTRSVGAIASPIAVDTCLNGTEVNTEIYVIEGPCRLNARCVAEETGSTESCGDASQLEFPVNANTDYHIFVGGNLDGPISVSFSDFGCDAVNDCPTYENDMCTSLVCELGECVFNQTVICNDNDACTDDTCNPLDGTCIFTTRSSCRRTAPTSHAVVKQSYLGIISMLLLIFGMLTLL